MVVPTAGAAVGCAGLVRDFDVRVIVALQLDIEPIEFRLHMEVAEVGPYVGGLSEAGRLRFATARRPGPSAARSGPTQMCASHRMR